MKDNKPIIVKRSVKHVFNQQETAQLNVDFGQAYDAVKSAEADFDSVKAVHKSKITEAESRMTTLRAVINAGFEMRVKECVVIFRPKDKKKDFYLAETFMVGSISGQPSDENVPLFTEDMTPDDFEQDLIAAESIFDKRVELVLWEAGNDKGKLVVGQLSGRWYSAIRGNVGAIKIEERLDSEQKATKKRFDAIASAAKRVREWIKANLGKEAAKGFEEKIDAVVQGEIDKAE